MSTSIQSTMRAIAILVTSLTIVSCSSVYTKEGNYIVEKKASTIARYLTVTAEPSESGVTVRGTMERKNKSRLKMPGHLEITLLTKTGDIVDEMTTEIKRVRHKSRIFEFNAESNQQLPEGGRVQIIHHLNRSHE